MCRTSSRIYGECKAMQSWKWKDIFPIDTHHKTYFFKYFIAIALSVFRSRINSIGISTKRTIVALLLATIFFLLSRWIKNTHKCGMKLKRDAYDFSIQRDDISDNIFTICMMYWCMHNMMNKSYFLRTNDGKQETATTKRTVIAYVFDGSGNAFKQIRIARLCLGVLGVLGSCSMSNDATSSFSACFFSISQTAWWMSFQ